MNNSARFKKSLSLDIHKKQQNLDVPVFSKLRSPAGEITSLIPVQPLRKSQYKTLYNHQQFEEIARSKNKTMLKQAKRIKSRKRLKQFLLKVFYVTIFLKLTKQKTQCTKMSHEAIDFQKHLFPLYPRNQFKLIWDVIILILLLFTAFYLPYRIGFIEEHDNSIFYIDIFADLIFAIDIFVIFVSCYHDSCNELVTKSKSIAMNYLTGWFIFDLIAVLPINEILALTSSDYGWVYLINKSFRLLRLNRINTISREATFLEKSKLLKVINLFEIQVGKLLKLLTVMILVAHMFACFWYLSSKVDLQDYDWVMSENLNKESNFTIFVNSLYWAWQTITTVGYGDVTAQNTVEFTTAIACMLLGAIFNGIVIGNLADTIQQLDSESTFKQIITQFQQLFKAVFVFQEHSQSVFQYVHYNNRNNFSWSLQFQEWFQSLPNSIQKQITLYVSYSIVKRIHFLKLNLNFSMLILRDMKLLKAKKNSLLWLKGDPVDEIYFLIDGHIQLRTQYGKPLLDISPGCVFGEQEYFDKFNYTKVNQRTDYACATDDILYITFQSDNFFSQVQIWPALMRYLAIQANNRAEKIKQSLLEIQLLKQHERQNKLKLQQIRSANNIKYIKDERKKKQNSIIYDTSQGRTINILERVIITKHKKMFSMLDRFRKVVKMIIYTNRYMLKQSQSPFPSTQLISSQSPSTQQLFVSRQNSINVLPSRSAKITPLANILRAKQKFNNIIKNRRKKKISKIAITYYKGFDSLKDIITRMTYDEIIEDIELPKCPIEQTNNSLNLQPIHRQLNQLQTLLQHLKSVKWFSQTNQKDAMLEIEQVGLVISKIKIDSYNKDAK